MREKRENEIDLKSLFFYILRRWMWVLLAAFTGMLVIGGIKAVQLRHLENFIADAIYQDQNTVSDEQEKLNEQLLLQEANERIIQNQKSLLVKIEEYMQNSVLMQLDPYNKLVIEHRYLISMNGEDSYEYVRDPADAVVSAYLQGLAPKRNLKDLSKKYGIDSVYLNELISFDYDIESNMVVITATGDSEEIALDLLQVMDKILASKQNEISELYGQHIIQLVSEDQGYITDNELLKLQRNNQDALISIQTNLSKTHNTLSDVEAQIEVLEASLKEYEKQATKVSGRTVIKYGILGFLLGGCALLGWYLLQYVLQTKLRIPDEMSLRWDIPVLGVIDRQSNSIVFRGVDEWLLKVAGERNGQNDEVVAENLAVTIESMLRNGSELIVTGDVSEEKLNQMVERLQKQLQETQIKVVAISTLQSDPQARRKLFGSDAVLLLVERDYSSYQHISDLVNTTKAFAKPVIGALVY